MRPIPVLAYLAAALLVGGCGGEPGAGTPASGPIRGEYYGQEVWLTYFSPAHAAYGRRMNRTRAQARALAESLRARVASGEDVGEIAREHSNAPGAAARGFSGRLPANPGAPSARDRAMASVEVGELTPIVDWMGGMWFARRIDTGKARELEGVLDVVRRERAKARAIVLLYEGAWVPDPSLRSTRPKEQAIELGRQLLERAGRGEDFATLARKYSDDPASRARGGMIAVTHGKDDESTPWIHRWETWVPDSVLQAIFETPPNTVVPHVVVSERGVFVLKVEDRRRLPPGADDQ